jgi:hypothetical protein
MASSGHISRQQKARDAFQRLPSLLIGRDLPTFDRFDFSSAS